MMEGITYPCPMFKLGHEWVITYHTEMMEGITYPCPRIWRLCYVIYFNQNVVEYEHSDITDNADLTVSDIVTSLLKDSVYPKNKRIGP